ncbi:Bacteriophage protein gp37 [uncultured Desulfobacterium sp.]|uniref:Bacteriophage protein gp37 n=1 Tax=uncultured Desulfobacterium sp. TaxID=201089 RepID=A0A445MRY1_9BACT|nr:Bacteriophage protein gp37 [uncultured Desulfobacterium sp.]
MGENSKIEWTSATWNPVTGCTKISAGCLNCYAERMANRLRLMGQPNYRAGFKVKTHPNALLLPLKWKKPRMIFVNSMSDLFHEEVPASFITKVFQIMETQPQHIFQVLTKRSKRLYELRKALTWPENVWMGVTVENSEYRHRIDELRATPAKTKFLSIEPLLGTIPDLDLTNIDWVIVGGESGPGARPMASEWARDIRDQCLAAGIPFFFKQWGGINKKKAGRLLDGRSWNEMPSLVVKKRLDSYDTPAIAIA